MKLADQKQQNERDELEPILYAALINSMLQNFWAIFMGSASTAVAAVMTALKTGDVLLWPMAVLIISIGTVRALQMRKYENRTLTFEEAKHLEPRYAVGAMVYAAVLGLWCFITIYGNDDSVADLLCVEERRLFAQFADPLVNGVGQVFAFLCGQFKLQATPYARIRQRHLGQQCRQAF